MCLIYYPPCKTLGQLCSLAALVMFGTGWAMTLFAVKCSSTKSLNYQGCVHSTYPGTPIHLIVATTRYLHNFLYHTNRSAPKKMQIMHHSTSATHHLIGTLSSIVISLKDKTSSVKVRMKRETVPSFTGWRAFIKPQYQQCDTEHKTLNCLMNRMWWQMW